MRILVVSQYFWPESFRINDLVLGLRDIGHDVNVLTGKPNYPRGIVFPGYKSWGVGREEFQDVQVLRVPVVPRGKGGALCLILNYLSFALMASLLGPILCRGQYDAIIVFQPSPITVGLPALLLKKIKKAPILFWVQDLWPESLIATGAVQSKLVISLVGRLVRFIYKRCDKILIQSQAFAKPIQSFGVELDRLCYLPNSAEGLYSPVLVDKGAPERQLLPKGFLVMFAGNIGVAQDFNTILAAAEKLKVYSDIHWVILGDGRMLSWVKEQVLERKLTGNFHLVGRHPVEAMPRYFSLADVLLVSLKSEPIFALTIPAKIQSYLASSKPIVASLDGEGARIVNDSGAGFAPGAENPEGLASAVMEMYRMSVDERQRMGERGRKYFELHFERNLLLKRLDGWLEEVK